MKFCELIKKAGISVSDAAKVLNLTYNAVAKRMTNDSEAKVSELQQIETYTGLNLYRNENLDFSDKAVQIPYLDIEGMPREYFQDRIVTELYYDKQIICDRWGYKRENLRATKMLGDKMAGGEYPLNNEDVLLVDITAKNIFSPGVYVFTTHNKNVFICGIMKLMSGDVRFYFYNQNYPEKILSDEVLQDRQFKVIGRVVKNLTLRI